MSAESSKDIDAKEHQDKEQGYSGQICLAVSA